jgi:hypothetical protein
MSFPYVFRKLENIHLSFFSKEQQQQQLPIIMSYAAGLATLKGRSLVSIADLSKLELTSLLALSVALKKTYSNQETGAVLPRPLAHKSVSSKLAQHDGRAVEEMHVKCAWNLREERGSRNSLSSNDIIQSRFFSLSLLPSSC